MIVRREGRVREGGGAYEGRLMFGIGCEGVNGKTDQ